MLWFKHVSKAGACLLLLVACGADGIVSVDLPQESVPQGPVVLSLEMRAGLTRPNPRPNTTSFLRLFSPPGEQVTAREFTRSEMREYASKLRLFLGHNREEAAIPAAVRYSGPSFAAPQDTIYSWSEDGHDYSIELESTSTQLISVTKEDGVTVSAVWYALNTSGNTPVVTAVTVQVYDSTVLVAEAYFSEAALADLNGGGGAATVASDLGLVSG